MRARCVPHGDMISPPVLGKSDSDSRLVRLAQSHDDWLAHSSAGDNRLSELL